MIAGCFSQPVPPSVNLEGVDVLHYEVDLTLDAVRLEVAGRTTITLMRGADVENLTLGLNGPVVDSVFVNGQRVRQRREGAAGFTIPLPSSIDTVFVDVHYHGSPREGLYAGTHAGTRIVYTDGWPHRVAGWMPGVHHPADPARLDLTLRADSTLEVAASGRRVHFEPGLSRWSLSSSAPTYTFAFAVAPYDRTEPEQGDVEVTHVAIPQDLASASEALSRTGGAIASFERLLGPYPYEVFSTVQVPFDFAGMENASAAFLAANLYGTAALEEVMVHEVAHQWFGNDVTIADWRDLWISEGITTYLTTLFYEDADGEEAANEMRADFATVSPEDDGFMRPLVPDETDSPYDMLSWHVYRKGAAVMHLLRLKLGDGPFFNALRDAYLAHRSEPASTASLIEHFSEAAIEPLGDVVDYWIYGEELPRLVYSWDAASRMLSWQVLNDGGTLADLPFLLEIGTAGDVWYVDAREGAVEVAAVTRPTVRPVGIMMIVESQ